MSFSTGGGVHVRVAVSDLIGIGLEVAISLPLGNSIDGSKTSGARRHALRASEPEMLPDFCSHLTFLFLRYSAAGDIKSDESSKQWRGSVCCDDGPGLTFSITISVSCESRGDL